MPRTSSCFCLGVSIYFVISLATLLYIQVMQHTTTFTLQSRIYRHASVSCHFCGDLVLFFAILAPCLLFDYFYNFSGSFLSLGPGNPDCPLQTNELPLSHNFNSASLLWHVITAQAVYLDVVPPIVTPIMLADP